MAHQPLAQLFSCLLILSTYLTHDSRRYSKKEGINGAVIKNLKGGYSYAKRCAIDRGGSVDRVASR
jgi:hypothetical protein